MLLKNYDSSVEEFLHGNKEATIPTKPLQKPLLKVHRCVTSGNLSCLREFFNIKVLQNNLRINNLLQLPKARTAKYGNKSLSFKGSRVWN